MKKIFLFFLAIVFFIMIATSVQANEKGEVVFFTASKLKTPVGVIIYQDLEIDLGVKAKKRWTYPPLKWDKYYLRGDFLGFVIPEKDKKMNIHVLVSKDISDNLSLEEDKILKLGERELSIWCKKSIEKKIISEDNFCFGEIISVCVNGQERTPAFFLESSVYFPNGNIYEMSFLYTVYKKREIFFIFKNFNKVKKSSDSFREDLTKEFFENISFQKKK